MIYLPGDVLLYSGTSLTDWLIRVKSWSRISHCEVVSSNGSVVASRFTGVNRYELTTKDLVAVMRPLIAFNVEKADAFFETVKGQEYDYIGLFGFFDVNRQADENGKRFCSELATEYLRAGGVDPFNGYPAAGIAPGEFLKSIVFTKHEV